MKKDFQLRDYFLFTQHSLSTFENCPLKFRKRYLENLKWEGYPDENIKRRLEMGNDFHLLAYRYFLGIEEGLAILNERNEELDEWLKSLKGSFKTVPQYRYLPEYKIRMADSILKLEANFDLIIVKDNTLEIWDWKTHSQKLGAGNAGRKKSYRESLQTIVYMFVLKEQSRLVAGCDIPCENISMCYWQPDTPHILEEIRYSDRQHKEAANLIRGKIQRIIEYNYELFDKAPYQKHCKYCEFNWFCNNERIDFKAMEEDEDFMNELEWDSVEEKF